MSVRVSLHTIKAYLIKILLSLKAVTQSIKIKFTFNLDSENLLDIIKSFHIIN